MVSYWLWVLVLGGLVLVGGVGASRLAGGREAAGARLSMGRVGIGGLLAAIAFVLCLPSRLPFARGTEMGYGVLLGLGAAVLGFISLRLCQSAAKSPEGADAALRSSEDATSLRAASPTPPPFASAGDIAATASLGGAALVWVAITQMRFHGDPSYALLGGIAGALLAILPFVFPLRREETALTALEFFGLAVLALGLGSLLAVQRYATGEARPLWVLPSVGLAGGLLGTVVAALLLGRARMRWAIAVVALLTAAAVWFGGQALLGRSYHQAVDPHLTYLLVMGWVVFLLVAVQSYRQSDRLAIRLALPLLATALVVIGFNLAGAYGVSVALAGGLAFSLTLWPAKGRQGADQAVLGLATLGLLFLAYRLFLATWGWDFRTDVRLEFGRHYVFVGMAVALVWALAVREQRPGRLAAFGEWAALAVLPVVVFVVFHHEALLGLVLGLWTAQLILPAIAMGSSVTGTVPAVFFPLVTVWALIIPNWAGVALDLPRSARALIVGGACALGLLALGLLRQREAPPAASEG